MPSEDYELLTSPIERRLVHRLFVIGGPVGLAIAIVLSLWVSHQRVTHAVVVQIEPQWTPGEPLALRVQVTPESPQQLGELQVDVAVEQGGQRHALPSPSPSKQLGGLAQGRLTVPSLTPGAATLHLHLEMSPFPPRDERIPIEVVAEREPVAGTHVVSTSMSQHADDSDEQPESVKIDVRPVGRVLAGFDNLLLVRVTDARGVPWSGPAAVRLVDGEMNGKRGDPDAPALLWQGSLDAAGLARVDGMLASEVLRLRVELLADDLQRVLHQRMIRLVSFAGAVQLLAVPRQIVPGSALEVAAAGLSAKRPVFVDAYGPDGAWADTFDPPIQGLEPPREWMLPAATVGLWQLEAYHFTNAPGESTAVGRVVVTAMPAGDPSSLRALVELQQQRLSLPRSDRTWDEARERAYLDALLGRSLSPAALAQARRWLIGTLPIQVHGPPTLLRSRERDLSAMAEKKRRWTFGLRVFLLGGGGLFLLLMGILMRASHARDAEATLAELRGITDGQEQAELEQHVAQARRGAMFNGLLALTMMAGALLAVALLLEKLVWEF